MIAADLETTRPIPVMTLDEVAEQWMADIARREQGETQEAA